MASVDVNPTDSSMSNSFTERVECIILSPTKETINPSKAFSEALASSKEEGGGSPESNGRDQMNESKESKDDSLDSSMTDSGLDTSGSTSAESREEKFVDRQESIVEPDDPDRITSPSKVIGQAFSFIDNEAQSLDAVNNNSEALIQDQADALPFTDDDVNQNSYLGVEVSLHDSVQVADKDEPVEKGKDQNAEAVPSDTTDASSNLYWYSNTLDLDPAELEDFKTSQSESPASMPNSYLGYSYYKDKLRKNYPCNASESSDIQYVPKSEAELREKWSPVFESASSHCLVVASEMKSDPKAMKNKENTSIRENEHKKDQHPWGLQTDQKMIIESGNNVTNDLPDLISVQSSEKDGESSSQTEQAVDVIDGKTNKIDSKAGCDSVGPLGQKNKKKALKIEEKTEKGDMEGEEDEWVNIEISDPSDNRKGRDVGDVGRSPHGDVVDAVGYMEAKDKPKEELIKASNAKGVESKQVPSKDAHRKGKGDEDLQEIQTMDVADAIGFMDIKDKPIEEMVQSTDLFYSKIPQGKNVSVKDAKKDTGKDSPDGSDQTVMEPVKEMILSKVTAVSETAVVNKEIQKPKEICNPVEVERKFQVSDDTEAKVLQQGGTLIETHTFIDEYIDDDHYTLLLKDSWLRLRNKKFEMKVTAPLSASSKCLQYNEITSEKEIKDMLLKCFGAKGKNGTKLGKQPLDVVIDELGLSEFVTFTTTRKIFKLQDGVVQLDLSDSGFQIGEISTIADHPQKLPAAIGTIGKMAVSLGMTPLQGTGMTPLQGV